MKTKIIASLVAIGMVATASADVLLWQVPDSTISTSDIYGNTQEIGTGDYAWSYAMLQYTDKSSISAADIDDISKDSAAATYWYGQSIGTKVGSGFEGEILSSDYDSVNNPNYYIALYNTSGSLVGYSGILESVSQFKAASHNIADWAGVNVASGSSWVAAPEPTSGMLLLLGMAALGLRRRKVA